jgi:plasmid maintenance system antidote protein VapI
MAKIHDYADVRSFMRDYFEQAKRKNPRWSLRAWANKLGLASASGLAMILNSKRNIGRDLALKLSAYFKFDEDEKEYFFSLVRLMKHPANAPLISLLQKQSSAGRKGVRRGKVSSALSRALSRDTLLSFRWYFYAGGFQGRCRVDRQAPEAPRLRGGGRRSAR